MNISSSLASLISVPSDNIIYAVILFVIGLVLIVKGGDVFVDATWIAEATGIPKFIIGATVVSFATTLPELLVSVNSGGKGAKRYGNRQCRRLGNRQYRPYNEYFRFVYAGRH